MSTFTADAIEKYLDRQRQIRVDRDKLREALKRLVTTFENYIHHNGVEHDPYCPQDDSCDCEHVAEINANIAHARRVLGEVRGE